MAQPDSRWPEARVQPQARPCGIYDRSGTRTGFSPSISFFPSSYHSTSAPYPYTNHRHHIMSATAASLNSIPYLKIHTRVKDFVTHVRCIYCAWRHRHRHDTDNDTDNDTTQTSTRHRHRHDADNDTTQTSTRHRHRDDADIDTTQTSARHRQRQASTRHRQRHDVCVIFKIICKIP